MAIDCFWRTDAETRCNTNVNCRNTSANCCNTNANTDAATQMRKQMLQHKCENRAGTQKLTQMVKVVIDDNRLVMEHAQVLEHRSWNTIADAGTQLLKHRHKCCNSGDDEDGQGLSLMEIGYEAVKVDNTHKRYWNIEAKVLKHNCWITDTET